MTNLEVDLQTYQKSLLMIVRNFTPISGAHRSIAFARWRHCAPRLIHTRLVSAADVPEVVRGPGDRAQHHAHLGPHPVGTPPGQPARAADGDLQASPGRVRRLGRAPRRPHVQPRLAGAARVRDGLPRRLARHHRRRRRRFDDTIYCVAFSIVPSVL